MLTRTRLLTALAALCLALLGVTATPAHAAGERPAAGQCRQLSGAQIDGASEPSAPVSCAKRHNAQTFAVVDVPDLATLTEDDFAVVGDAVCEAAYYKLLGQRITTAKLTAYTFFFFEPTADQLAAGESWVRCDLGMTKNGRFAALPRHRLKRPVVPAKVTDGIRLCLKAVPRSLAGYVYTTCSSKHDLRATATFKTAGKRTSYPSDRTFLKAAKKQCPKAFRYASWPSVGGWLAGDRWGVCFVED